MQRQRALSLVVAAAAAVALIAGQAAARGTQVLLSLTSRRKATALAAVAAAFALLPAGTTDATATGQLPRDLQRRLAAAAALNPAELTAHILVRDSDLADRAADWSVVMRARRSSDEIAITGVIDGQPLALLLDHHFQYLHGPGLTQILGADRWVRRPLPRGGFTGSATQLALQLANSGLGFLLQSATAVKQAGPAVIDGQHVIGFDARVHDTGTTTAVAHLFFASDGLLVRRAIPIDGGHTTTDLTTTDPVDVTTPPPNDTVDLGALSGHRRAAVSSRVIDVLSPLLMAVAVASGLAGYD